MRITDLFFQNPEFTKKYLFLQCVSIKTKMIFETKHISGLFYALIISIISSVLPVNLEAQLSPGKLAKSHSHLEGLSNCTKCHELGEKINESKCLKCHKDLKSRISANKGYHSSKELKSKKCISCHSDHHGVEFEMIRFDKNTFNHTLTGYKLEDKHKISDCKKCHKPDNISNPQIRKIKNSFLGLDTDCKSCHEDYHQQSLANDCAKCHDFKAFKPAPFFDHNKSKFQLKGAHEKVECKSCHQKEIKNGKDFQVFAGLKFKSCSNCHSDPHRGDFGINCESCHNETNFHQIKTNSNFNHSVTGFELIGKHKAIDCKKCHDNRQGTSGQFQEFKGKQHFDCIFCHDDIHNTKFGNDCTKCHGQNNFKIKDIPDYFNHDKTGYQLENKHKNVDCRKCHTGEMMTIKLPHDKCISCHTDYHEGQFDVAKYNDCASCHSTEGFNMSGFDIEKHNSTNFPLKGGHIATPCFECHKSGEKWNFKGMGNDCIQCHDNLHEGKINKKFMTGNDCRICHSEDYWADVSFDHNKTNFELIGEHSRIRCSDCHFIKIDNKNTAQKFENLDTQCESCHQNIHGSQFEVNGITDCIKCHGFEKWDRRSFNHDNARFKLDGAHEKLNCEKCHSKSLFDGKEIIIYKNDKLKCEDCHT